MAKEKLIGVLYRITKEHKRFIKKKAKVAKKGESELIRGILDEELKTDDLAKNIVS